MFSRCYSCCEQEDERVPVLEGLGEINRGDGTHIIRSSGGYEKVEEFPGAPTDKKWYHGRISHREAEDRLSVLSPSIEDGTYLVYDCPAKKNEYVLLVYSQGSFYKWRIIRRQSDGQYVLGEDVPGVKTYNSVSKLIKQHRGITGKHIQLEHGGTVKLTHYAYVA